VAPPSGNEVRRRAIVPRCVHIDALADEGPDDGLVAVLRGHEEGRRTVVRRRVGVRASSGQARLDLGLRSRCPAVCRSLALHYRERQTTLPSPKARRLMVSTV